MKLVVLIPHYNNIEGLKKSLNSIYYPGKLDVVIVDDGSKVTPNDEDLKKEFLNLNIHLIFLKKNQGIEIALNTGLDYIKVTKRWVYIARLDCGDICSKDRFIIQEKFLDENPNVYLLGSWVKFISNRDGVLFNFKTPVAHPKIKKFMYLSCLFIHPSVVFRTEALYIIGNYPTDYKAAEDYAFFFKFVKNFETAIIPKFLVYCEATESGITVKQRKIQLISKIKIIKNNPAFTIFYPIGLLKNLVIYLLPYKFILVIKKMFF